MEIVGGVLALTVVAVCLNLLLTFGVIRRLREHTTTIDGLTLKNVPIPSDEIREGEKVGSFTALAADGTTVTHDYFDGEVTVGFFSPDCSSCKDKVNDFVDYAERAGSDNPPRILAVVIEGRESSVEFVEKMSSVGTVVIEKQSGPISAAFRVDSTPTWFRATPDAEGQLTVTEIRPEFRSLT
ncbi:hypothetical protein GCM10022221_52990 [Actinocorallia aurea]